MKRSPDLYLIALLEIADMIPGPIAEMLVDMYQYPLPVNYETARDFVHDKIHELIESDGMGALGEGSDEDGGVMVPPMVRASSTLPSEAGFGPPAWFLNAYHDWDELAEVEESLLEDDCPV